ncbi:MAG: hypothetical protein P8Z79_07000, partial [Sedimentisphaerales bacterium]
MSRRFRRVGFWGCFLVAVVVFGIVGGCSTERYRADADDEVYGIIADKWEGSFGNQSNYIINDSYVP